MTSNEWPTTKELLQAFTEEITDCGGSVNDSYDDGKRLYVRSVFPKQSDVRTKDAMQGGVAMRAADNELRIHPYLFRLVCSNGAIRAEAIQTRVIVFGEEYSGDVITEMRCAVRACANPEVFAEGVGQARSAAEHEADMMINLLPFLKRFPASMIQRILAGFVGGRDRSTFGAVNAVTAVARVTRDPETRWRLEEVGAGIMARLNAPRPVRRASAARELELV